MSQEALTIGGVGLGMILLGAGGLFLPASVNPLRLKKRYEKLATPSLAGSVPRIAGIGFLLLGLVLVATAIVQSMP